MLAKDAAARPADGDAFLQALAALPPLSLAEADERRIVPLVESPLSIGLTEQRVQCRLLLSPPRQGARFLSQFDLNELKDDIEQEVVRRGGVLQRLPCGVAQVRLRGCHTPVDEATQLARLALALREKLPTYAFGISTRQLTLSEILYEPTLSPGDVAGEIRVDSATAALLDSRFEIAQRTLQEGILRGERETEVQRTLLGKRTQVVGRQRELSTVEGILHQCIDEGSARIVLCTAPAGMGKSRFRAEFVRRVEERWPEVEILIGQGDAMAMGTSFLLIGGAIRRAAGIIDGEPPRLRCRKLQKWVCERVPAVDQERVMAFLGEAVRAPFPDSIAPSLAAARHEPMLMIEGIASAWERLLLAMTKTRPLLLVLEDVQFGDLPSVKLIDSAVENLADCPLMVLALARPEVYTVFPQLWAHRSRTELRLEPLGKKACEQLIHAVLGKEIPPAMVNRIIERSGGNAFFLEELIRALASGVERELPETVLAMVQARLDGLGAEARRVLQAASVFGEVFWEGGVLALLGDQAGGFPVSDLLEHLVAREIIVRQRVSRIPEETEFRYRHALVQEAAYQMLTPADRVLAHRLAASWLEGVGERDALVLAEHFVRGQAPERAVTHYLAAAEQALDGNDLEAVMERTEKARQAGAEGESLGMVWALKAAAAYWEGMNEEAEQRAEIAAALLRRGSAAWFQTIGMAAVSAARRSLLDVLLHWHQEMLAADAEPDARDEQIICLSRCCFQWLQLSAPSRAEELLRRLVELTSGLPLENPLTRAQFQHAAAEAAAMIHGDISLHLSHVKQVVASFEEAGDMRNVLIERTTIGYYHLLLGDVAQAEAICRQNLQECQKRRVMPALLYTKIMLSLALIHDGNAGKRAEAQGLLNEVLPASQATGHRRWQGVAEAGLAMVEMENHHDEAAARHGKRAIELLADSPAYLPWGLAVYVRALVQQGRAADAVPEARKGLESWRRCGYLGFGLEQSATALILAFCQSGHPKEAQSCLEEAQKWILRSAEQISDGEARQIYLAFPERARILAMSILSKAAVPSESNDK